MWRAVRLARPFQTIPLNITTTPNLFRHGIKFYIPSTFTGDVYIDDITYQ